MGNITALRLIITEILTQCYAGLFFIASRQTLDSPLLFLFYLARSQNFEKRLLASSCPSFRLSVRREQLGSHWTDFYEILYLSIIRKSF
jgi:hypothetical protein